MVAIVRLPVALLPELRYPGLVVWTSYPDVPPERVERAVTERVEEAVAGTSGLQRIMSRSLLGGSLTHLQFGWNANMDLALLEVRENIDRLGDHLPEEASRPALLHLDPGDRPIMVIAMRYRDAEEASQPQDLTELKKAGRDIIARRLEQIADVAQVQVTGGYERRIDITVDPAQLQAYGISLGQIATALQVSNVALSGGVIRRGPFRYAVEVSGEFQSTEDVAATVISTARRIPVRLSEVADVRNSVEDRRGMVRLNGAETLLLLIERRADANVVFAASEIRQVLGELELEYESLKLDVVVDESTFIQAAIDGVTQAVLIGGLLAVLVLFVFLRRLRALLAVAIAVPLSLGATLVFFEPLGVTFNLIALSGLALGTGMLVDNAIVVIENIVRLREAGLAPMQAARQGAWEVAGAITASTLTTMAVFLPITLVDGLAGRLFRDQSLAVVCSLLASLLVALTVVPLIVSKEREAAAPQGPARAGAGGRLLAAYERLLAWSLDHRAAVMGLCVVVLTGAGLILLSLPREVIPRTEQGRVEIRFTLPTDADLALVAARAQALRSQIQARGWAETVLADLGERDQARLDLDPRPPYTGDLTLLLPPGMRVERVLGGFDDLEVPNDVQLQARRVETQLESLLTTEEADLLIDLVSEDRRDAELAAPTVLERLAAREELDNVLRADAALVPTYQLGLRRDVMNRYGVQARAITAYLEAGARGSRATTLKTVNEEIPIVLRSRHVDSLERLLAERIPTRDGLMPLGTFVTVTRVNLPAALVREGQASVLRLTADVAQQSDLNTSVAAVRSVLANTLPPAVRHRVGGASEVFQKSLMGVALSLALSLLLVYLILAAQFEHFIQPLIVLISVPLAAAGVAVVLGLTGQSINLMSLMGCIVLVGIVVNDAIIKTDFINQRRAAGMPLREAILVAGRDRVRPILMTTATTVLGLLPLALGFGQGSELRAPLAIAIAGGLTSATVLTLFVVPVLYSLVTKER